MSVHNCRGLGLKEVLKDILKKIPIQFKLSEGQDNVENQVWFCILIVALKNFLCKLTTSHLPQAHTER